MKHVAALVIFLLPVVGAVAKHTVLGGSGPIWPWMLASCAVAALWTWRGAALLAVGVALGQYAEQTQGHLAPFFQFALWSVLAFAAHGLVDRLTAVAAAVVGLLYASTMLDALAWFPAVVATEFVIVGGLIGGAYTSGPGCRSMGRTAPAVSEVFAGARGDRRACGAGLVSQREASGGRMDTQDR